MVILSCRISWITTSRSVRLPRSTSGRAPSMSSSMRFWIRAVSLNRPPTLFTISSLLSASIIGLNTSGSFVLDNLGDLLDRAVEAVVDDHVIERPRPLGHVNLALGRAETLVDVLGAVPPAVDQTLQQCRLVGRQNEDEQRVGVMMPDLQRPLHVNFQQHVAALLEIVQGRVLGRRVIISVHLRVFQVLIAVE